MATEDKKMKQRRGTAANWTSADPVLAAGEFGYETDTGKLKVGDGTTVWTSLAYFSAGGGDLLAANNLSDLANAATARTNLGVEIGVDVQAWHSYLDQISSITDQDGDQILFWDDSAGAFVLLALGTGLTITGTTLDAAGGVPGVSGDGTDITVSPAAAGSLIIQQAATPTDHILKILTSAAANLFNIEASGRVNITERIIGTGAGNYIQWGDMQFGDPIGLGMYAGIQYNASYGLKLRDNSGNVDFTFDAGGFIEMYEATAPANAPANAGRLYFEDDGSGKTRLMVIFQSGAAQQIAIET